MKTDLLIARRSQKRADLLLGPSNSLPAHNHSQFLLGSRGERADLSRVQSALCDFELALGKLGDEPRREHFELPDQRVAELHELAILGTRYEVEHRQLTVGSKWNGSRDALFRERLHQVVDRGKKTHSLLAIARLVRIKPRDFTSHLSGLGKRGSFCDTNVFRLGEETQSFLAAFAADAALCHAGVSACISFLREAFTFFAFGNTLATSGSKTTTLAPSA